ncbi:MAG: hypothetical protein EXQ79_10705 [Acidimicrobiia bacterium]|nr:hypothetical protein [Acidimicrobiia bacterium]
MNSPLEARARAEELARDGRFLEAISVLTDANRAQPSGETETRLVELRRGAAADVVARRGIRTWPPKTQERFRGVVGLPEVTRDQLTPEILRSGVLRHGCLLVRGMVDQPRIDHLIDDIERSIVAHDAHGQGTPIEDTAPWFVPFDPGPGYIVPRDWGRAGGGVLAVDSPRALFDLIETFEEAGVGDLVAGFLGERPVILAKKWTLRRARQSEAYPVWHQDGAFMGREIRSLNVWLALSHCGIDAPGLDVVGRRLTEIVEFGTHEARFDWCVDDTIAARVGGNDIVSPVFAPGDALLFDHMLLHRTRIRPGMTHDRYAVEAWFAAPSSYPEDQIAITY